MVGSDVTGTNTDCYLYNLNKRWFNLEYNSSGHWLKHGLFGVFKPIYPQKSFEYNISYFFP